MAFAGNERFQIKRRLGIGGMGEVYEAFDCQTQEIVALKTLYHTDAKNIARFKKEFFALKGLAHPNLVRLNEFFEENEEHFFSMEMVEGTDFLSAVRHREPQLDENKLRNCITQLALGITSLHENGKVHRDLKPSNIIVTDKERVVILDFGLVTDVIAGRQLGDVAAVGTAAYMSPEQSAGMPVGAAVDWYSVGVLLYQALTGRLPYEGSLLKMQIDRQMSSPPEPTFYSTDVPPDLSELCMELLSYDPNDRPNGRQVLKRLGVELPPPEKLALEAGGAERYEESIPFVGRAKELGILRAAFDLSRMGHDLSIVILGEPGLGKTALAREFLKQTQEKKGKDRLLILSGRCKKNTALLYQAFDSIISGLSDFLQDVLPRNSIAGAGENGNNSSKADLLTPDEASAIVKVFPALRRVKSIVKTASIRGEKPHPGRTRAHAFRAVGKLLRFAASLRALILFIDDLQWARDDSLDLLKDVMYLTEGSPLFLIVTMRSENTLSRKSDDILPGFKRLSLERLTKDDSTELAKTLCSVYGNHATDDKLSTIIQESEGHPLFLAELVRYMIVEGNVKAGSLEDVLWSRIQLLGEDAFHLLELISLAGIALTYETLADAADMTLENCVRSASTLLAQNLVLSSGLFEDETLEPYHDRVHETVIPQISPERKKRYHRKLAFAIGLEDRGIDQAVIVGHLEEAGLTKDASRLAEKAAKQASNSLAFGQAADLIHTALRIGEHDDQGRQKLLMELGDALCNIGRGAEASKTYLEARKGADVLTGFELWRRAAEQLILAGHFREGFEELGRLLAEIGEGFSANRVRTLVSLLWKRTVLSIRGLRWQEKSEAELDGLKLARVDAYQVVAEILAMVDNILGANYQARRLLAALRLGETKRIGHAFVYESVFFLSQGTRKTFRRGLALIERAKIIAETHAIPRLRAECLAASGIAKYCQGEAIAAKELFIEAETQISKATSGLTVPINNVRLFKIRVHRLMGEFEQLKEFSEQYLRDAARQGDKYMEANMRYLRSSIWLVWDLPADATRDLSAIVWSPPEEGYHMQHWYSTLARAEIALYEGTVRDNLELFQTSFLALTKSLLLRMGIYRAEYWWIQGRILLDLAVKAKPNQAKRLLKRAERMARKLTVKNTNFRPVKTWSLLLKAAIANQRGEQKQMIRFLREAIVESDGNGCGQTAAAARWQLAEVLPNEEAEEFRDQCNEWMKKVGVVKPERLTRIYLPGFR